MFKSSCPGCGAELAWRSAASVTAVCAYCQTLVLKDAESVKDVGKLSAVFEDYTPLQIGSSGVYQGQGFTLVGRLQLRYPEGHWNEWYAVFDDGSGGWLADASGQYVFTRQQALPIDAPLFDKLSAGNRWFCDGRNWFAADVRVAQAVAGQGELPFALGEGWQAKVADYRSGSEFLTLDYSFGHANGQPEVFRGQAVTLDGLQCQMLREEHQVFDSAGSYKGGFEALGCPQCGSAISHAPGLTAHLLCPACHSEIDLSGGRAEVLAKHRELEAVHTTLALGDIATIDKRAYALIGLLAASEVGEADSHWIEYLLFHPKSGFLWLVESSEGWQRVRVLDNWPERLSDTEAALDKKLYKRQWDYEARVDYAAGAFNWRVKIGDSTRITDYACGQQTLTRELTAQEMTLSLAERVGAEQVGQWFKREDIKKAAPARATQGRLTTPATSGVDAAAEGIEMRTLFIGATILLWLLNLPIILFGDGSLFITLVAQAAIWPSLAQRLTEASDD